MQISIKPEARPLAAVRHDARLFCKSVEDPPITFREALAVYRSMREGRNIFIRCKFQSNGSLESGAIIMYGRPL